MFVRWPVALDRILAGDQVVALASVTPARGVVIAPMTNFATHDLQTGTVRVNSSAGAGKKLERIRRNPNVALAFHTRDQGTADGCDFVLVQGRATVGAPVENFPDTIGRRWDEKDGAPPGGLWRHWLRAYYTRVPIDIAVDRIISWPDLRAAGQPVIHGAPAATHPAPQRSPKGGIESRLDPARVLRGVAALPHVLAGWVGEDGYPVVVPVSTDECATNGLRLVAGAPLFPVGGRRAGLTAHGFGRHGRSVRQRVHTGWLDADDDGRTATYYPHTGFGFRMPPSTLLYRLIVGFSARRGMRALSL